MSADNWAVCPFCAKRKALNVARMADEVEAAYGKVTVEEFDALRQKFEAFRDERMLATFREDYEQGLMSDDGSSPDYFVRYKGRCTECNFSHEFRHDETLKIEVPNGT